MKIKAVFFDIGGTIHVQEATPEQDVQYADMVHKLLAAHGIDAGQPQELLARIDAGASKYKKYVVSEKNHTAPRPAGDAGRAASAWLPARRDLQYHEFDIRAAHPGSIRHPGIL